MKKIIYSSLTFLIAANFAFAKPVSSTVAQQVAENFYRLNAKSEIKDISLCQTALSSEGKALYYVFNVNENGFVIVSADDVANPIIGYSNETNYTVPEKGTTIGNWMQRRSNEINYLVTKNLSADKRVSNLWSLYTTGVSDRYALNTTANAVSPMVQTKWNQSPQYNAMCPGGSVTGCVATAMAQIMRYWKYPATGNGSSSYCDCTPNYSMNYGTLSANYGATTYNWNNMPLQLTGANADVALFNYQCGVSVQMDYSPSGSGAWVCAFDNPVCAQNSYINYFRYDPSTIQGLERLNYNDSTWISMLKADIDLGRPIQYAGWDPNAGGHTWVCDGYDANDNFHMNWGWGGQSNGYFSINNMNPGYNFSDGHQAVFGIVPMANNSLDAAIPSIASPAGYSCNNNFSPSVKLQNNGSTTLTSATINYQLDGGSLQTVAWNGSLVFGQYTYVSLPSFVASIGSHTMICTVVNPNSSTDQNASNDSFTSVFHVSQAGTLPVVEGFEVSTLPGSDWSVSNNAGTDWTVTSSAAANGTKCAMIDNSMNTPGNSSTLQTNSTYDLASYSSPVLSFKMAYQLKNSNTSEKLQVFASADCGTTWMSRWAHSNTSLPTVSGTANGFTPSPSDFITYTVNLSPLLSYHNVLFKWVFTSDPTAPGNNIYLDDINILNSAASVNNIEANTNLNLYPNPSSGAVNIEMNLPEHHLIAVHVTDVLGRSVETLEPKNFIGETKLIIGAKKNYEAGVYLVHIDVDGQRITKKVLVQ